MKVNLENLFYVCRCKEKATVQVTTKSCFGSSTEFFCSDHFVKNQKTQSTVVVQEDGFPLLVDDTDLLSSDGFVMGENDNQWVFNDEGLKGFKPDLEKLVVPDVKDEKNGPALLLKQALDKEITGFKDKFVPNNVTLTNAFHFRALLTAIDKLNALIRYPQKGGVLKDYRTRGGSALSTTELNIDSRQFTVGKGHCVTITLPEDLGTYEPYLSAPGFLVTVHKFEQEGDQLKVNFDLEMDEWTKMAASAGDARGEFMIGYINTKTQNGLFTQAVASSQ